MKRNLLLTILLVCVMGCMAKKQTSLDAANAIVLKSKCIIYHQQTIYLGEKSIFINGNLSDEEAARSPYVFNSFTEAMKHLVAGTSDQDRMKVYIAPYVYWVDDPDDPKVRVGERGGAPIGMHINCPYLTLIGLTPNPENVVLASNRGQQQGAYGNFTMFYFHGDGISLNNLTLGNYCNIDLVFPLKPELNRKKRMESITQAQLAFADGDRLEAHHCRFVSRLNTCPLNGGKRTFFERCHFESTDDAMCPTGVYLSCDFDFYGSMPFGHTAETGAVLLDCDFHTRSSDVNTHRSTQYLIKSRGPISIIDCRYHTPEGTTLAWKPYPTPSLRCYQAHITQNGKPVVLQSSEPQTTVCLEGKRLLDAYKITHQGKIIYNTYNLLGGDDNWDPMHIQPTIGRIEQETGKTLHQLPTYLTIEASANRVEEGREGVSLNSIAKRFCGYPAEVPTSRWSLSHPDYAQFSETDDSANRHLISINTSDTTRTVYISTDTDDGLSAGYAIQAAPRVLPAPEFIQEPVIKNHGNGVLSLDYVLDLGSRADQSVITWYRCDDAKGSHPVAVSISRCNQPEQTYQLQPSDANHYIMAVIAPRHIRCLPIPEKVFRSPQDIQQTDYDYCATSLVPISPKDIPVSTIFETDFQHFPAFPQPLVQEGYWTLDGYKPLDTAEHPWNVSENNWGYGTGEGGATGMGLLHLARGARMLYTPAKENVPDQATTMSVSLLLDPTKQAGQGFGSPTGQYFDVMIHYDTRTLSGYGLRIIRTTKYANAVDMMLMKYENGQSAAITEPISTTCFLTHCDIRVWTDTEGNLHAHVSTTSPQRVSNLAKEVSLSAKITPPTAFGFGLQHTGSSGSSALMLHHLKIQWGGK